jgi:hypothetical protein
MMDILAMQDEIMERQLNLDKIFKLPEDDKQIVMSLFQELLDSFYGEKGMDIAGGLRVDHIRASVVYNTLIDNDYLVTKRESNLDKILS